jgi:hypothetical protein
MMLQIYIDSEQNSFGQEYFSLCLESEDTVIKKKKNRDFFSSSIVNCVLQLGQDFLLDHELNIVESRVHKDELLPGEWLDSRVSM